jgi:cytochrome P450 family 6
LFFIFPETLRKYSPVGMLVRKSNEDYMVPNMSLTISKGTTVMIPVHGIHRDASLYPDPEKFDPERFNPEEVQKRHPCAFLPFGEGPRNCIGMRFGQLQSKLGLAKLLMNYKLTLDDKTQQPMKQDPQASSPSILGDVWLKAEKLSCTNALN